MIDFKPLCRTALERLARNQASGRVVLFTGSDEEKQLAITAALDSGDVQFVSVGRELSRRLVEVPAKRRAVRTESYLAKLAEAGPVCFFDTEILFDPGMEIDPVRTLLHVAGGTLVYCEWPGPFNFESLRLSVADPGDVAYREYPVDPRMAIVDVSGKVFPDS